MSHVVLTGSTKGIGLALAARFLNDGDSVVISSRNADHLGTALASLSAFGERVAGIPCDVTRESDLRALGDFAERHFGRIDLWINNAGSTGGRHALLVELGEQAMRTAIETNLLGTMLGTREALSRMIPAGRGHVFAMDGYGSNGRPTPGLAPYGASKRAIPQLVSTLVKETAGTGVGVHTLSPGMVLTDLLLKDAQPAALRIFNILAERPDTVADFLVDRIRRLPDSSTGTYIRFLTGPKILYRFLTAGARKNRFFPAD